MTSFRSHVSLGDDEKQAEQRQPHKVTTVAGKLPAITTGADTMSSTTTAGAATGGYWQARVQKSR